MFDFVRPSVRPVGRSVYWVFTGSDRLSDQSDEAFTRYDRRTTSRTDQSDRPVGPTIGTCKRPLTITQLYVLKAND